MALSSELRQVLAKHRRSRPRELRLEAQAEESRDVSAGAIAPDDRSQADITARIDITFEVPLALPPPQPSWSFLCDRPGASVSLLLARSALESVGCRLGFHPSQSVQEQAVKGCSAGALRRLIADGYGQRGLDAAYQLGGILQRSQSDRGLRGKVTEESISQRVETSDALVSGQGFTSQARIQRWFDRSEAVRPPWRSSPPPAGADDGSWVGC
jgi:hypothetical protein